MFEAIRRIFRKSESIPKTNENNANHFFSIYIHKPRKPMKLKLQQELKLQAGASRWSFKLKLELQAGASSWSFKLKQEKPRKPKGKPKETQRELKEAYERLRFSTRSRRKT